MPKDARAINSDDLRLVSSYLDEATNTIIDARLTLRTELDGLGEPWGDDENGIKFSSNYVPARDKTLKTLGEVGDDFHTLQKDINDTADSYEETEKDNTR